VNYELFKQLSYRQKLVEIAKAQKAQFTPSFWRVAVPIAAAANNFTFNPVNVVQDSSLSSVTVNRLIAQTDAFITEKIGIFLAIATGSSSAALQTSKWTTYGNEKILGTNFAATEAIYRGFWNFNADQNNVIQYGENSLFRYVPITQAQAGQVATAASGDTTSPGYDSRNPDAGYYSPDPAIMIIDGQRNNTISFNWTGQASYPSDLYVIVCGRGYTVTGGAGMTKNEGKYNSILRDLSNEYEGRLYKG